MLGYFFFTSLFLIPLSIAIADFECGWNGGYAIYCPLSAPVCCTDHCCPTSSPVCCNDGQSCCWNGTICDPAHKRCLVVDGNFIRFNNC